MQKSRRGRSFGLLDADWVVVSKHLEVVVGEVELGLAMARVERLLDGGPGLQVSGLGNIFAF